MALSAARNPYTPGAGQTPSALTGRDQQLDDFAAVLSRLELDRAAQCTLLIGLRGVGKTVLLNQLGTIARDRQRWVVVEHELRPESDLFAGLARLAREAVLTLAPPSRWSTAGRRLGSLLSSIEVTWQLPGLSIAAAGGGGTANGPQATADMAHDATELVLALGTAAREHDRGVVLLLDEIQFGATTALGGLLAGMHKAAQRNLPITLVAAGLPQARAALASASSYAERLFNLVEVGRLGRDDAIEALRRPAAAEHVVITPEALQIAVDYTEGYPFFLQVIGDHLWRAAQSPTIDAAIATEVKPLVTADLDRGFFTFRTDRLPDAQRRYLRAMAELGPGEQRSGEIATQLGFRSSAQAGPVRDALIRKGLIYSPRQGFAAFTVPHFDSYLRRTVEFNGPGR
jgi:hypothetical protein